LILLSVIEHARLRRGARAERTAPTPDGGAVLAPRHFDRLCRLDQLLARQRDQETILEWGQDSARARHWVGVLQAEGIALEILPRLLPDADHGGLPLARRNLLFLLSEAGDVPLRERELAALSTAQGGLSETLMALFAGRLLEQLLLGRAHHYEERQENVPALRGKLLLGQHLRQNAAHRERFFVARDDLTEDTPLNRAFKAASRALLELSREPRTHEALRRCLLCLRGVSDQAITPEALAALRLDRRHQRFDAALTLARMILSRLTPGVSAGHQRAFALLFDMNRVFEGFVTELMRRRVLPRLPGVTLHRHARERWRYLLESASSRRGVLRLEPDLLLSDERGQPLLTLDTKWKTLDMSQGRRGASREDLYQLYAYAQRYGCRHNLLLYPNAPHARPEDLIAPAGPGQRESLIGLRFIELRRELRAHRRDLEDELLALLGAALPAITPPR
jgi:5-methylcytosine-specific restriction enzyme subunit McrC